MHLAPGSIQLQRSGTSFLSKYAALLDILLRVGDVAIVAVAAYLCYWCRFGSLVMSDAYPSATLRAVLLALLIFPKFGLYRSWRGESVTGEIGRVCLAWFAVVALLLLSEWAIKSESDYSRLWIVSWVICTIVFLGVQRMLARYLLGSVRARGTDTRRVILIGATHAGRRIHAAVRNNPWMGLDVIGYVQTPYDQQSKGNLPRLGDVEQFIREIEMHAVDQIWIALPMRAEALIQRLLAVTNDRPITIRLIPDMFGYELINQHASTVAGVSVITLRGTHMEGHARVVKAVEDRLLAALLLGLMSPLMLLIAIGVKLSSPGPVFYRQKRHGLGGNEFDVWKFRSMKLHVEHDGNVTQASRQDSRVTRFGRFLRSSSIDELPQLINVLQGHMSIVGPRPHAVEHNHRFSEKLGGYMQRHGVKPGMTGLAQVKGFRGETDTLDKMARRVECDIDYIRHWSLWLDIKIILLTPLALIKRTNAY